MYEAALNRSHSCYGGSTDTKPTQVGFIWRIFIKKLYWEHPNFEQIFYPTPCKGAATQTKPGDLG